MPRIYKVIITPEAENDLFAIYHYIADRSGHARAGDFLKRIEAHCQDLSLFPDCGTRRETLPPALRISTYRHQATVAYAVHHARDQVSVLRIFGAGQDFEAILCREGPDVT